MNTERSEFKSVLQSFDTAMLVTKTGDGRLHARPMVIAEAREDGELWFVASRDSDKTREIRKDDHVSVTCQTRDRYLSVSGRVAVIDDPIKAAELWRESFRTWFPNGHDDPALLLIRIRAETAEYWDQRGPRGLKYAFAAAKAYVTGTPLREASREQHGKLVFL